MGGRDGDIWLEWFTSRKFHGKCMSLIYKVLVRANLRYSRTTSPISARDGKGMSATETRLVGEIGVSLPGHLGINQIMWQAKVKPIATVTRIIMLQMSCLTREKKGGNIKLPSSCRNEDGRETSQRTTEVEGHCYNLSMNAGRWEKAGLLRWQNVNVSARPANVKWETFFLCVLHRDLRYMAA